MITTKRDSLPAQKVGKKVNECDQSEGYKPFVHLGYVSLPGSNKQPVRILRDTGASQSMMLEGILPLLDKTALGSNVLVRGIGMTFIPVPLHKIHLKSDLVCDCVVVGVWPSLPVAGIDFLLGNDIGGGDIWGESVKLPKVVAVPLFSDQDKCAARNFPGVFPSCAITRAMSKRTDAQGTNRFEDLLDTFLADLHSGPIKQCDSNATKSLSPIMGSEEKSQELVKSQMEDNTLTSLFTWTACPSNDLMSQPPGYFFREGVLRRKWRPPNVPDDW